MRKRTSIIVSHRVSTVRDADVIVVLDDGRIVERATTTQLVRRDGFYAELHRQQLSKRSWRRADVPSRRRSPRQGL